MNKITTGLALFGATLIIGCATFQPDLPSITDTPTGDRVSGKIVWHDLITDTPAESRRFYEELFGWEFEGMGNVLGFGADDAYTLIRNDGRMIGGMIDANRLRNSQEDISQWVTVMSVGDVDSAVATVESGGGTVFTPPTDLESRGRIAVVADAEGAILALLKTRDGDPADRDPDYGDFLWDELWTTDVDKATGFYHRVAGLQPEDYDDDDDAREEPYRLLKQAGRPRVGIMLNPFDGVKPVWVNYLRVSDPAAITARVESLGGRVLIDAHARDIGGEVAFIAGPSGAGIALQTWPIRKDQE